MLLIVDLIALLIVLYYFSKGYRRGLLVSILSLIGLICAYISAYMFFEPAGQMILNQYDLPRLLALALGGFASFFIVYIFFGIIIRIISWRRRTRETSLIKTGSIYIDKLLGSISGTIFGLIMVAIILWGYNLAKFSQFGTSLPDINKSIAAQMSSSIIEKGTYLIADKSMDHEEMAKAISKSLSNPGEALEDMQDLMNSPLIKKLSDDKEFINAMLKGEVQKIKHNRTLNRALEDPVIINKAQDLGLLADDYNPMEMKEEIAEKLAKAGKEISKIQNDPKIRNLLNDNILKEKIERQNLTEMLQDNKFRELINRMVEVITGG